jgi:hypothetical protein
MTMGLAMILDRTVMLWADGRICRFDNPGIPERDDDDKIRLIGPYLAVMTSGIGLMGERVVKDVEINYHVELNLAQIINLVEFCLSNCWRDMKVADGFDVNDPSVNCGILAAGVALNQPFVFRSGCLYRKNVPTQLTNEPYQIVVNSRDSENALAIADQVFRTEMTGELCEGTYENYLTTVERIGFLTMGRVAKYDSSIGGIVRCAVLKPNSVFEKKIIGEI